MFTVSNWHRLSLIIIYFLEVYFDFSVNLLECLLQLFAFINVVHDIFRVVSPYTFTIITVDCVGNYLKRKGSFGVDIYYDLFL